MNLESGIPEGPLEHKWSSYLESAKLVGPNNRRKYDVIVVGTGLAGGASSTLSARWTRAVGTQITPDAKALESAL